LAAAKHSPIEPLQQEASVTKRSSQALCGHRTERPSRTATKRPTEKPATPRGLSVAGILQRYLRPFLEEYCLETSSHPIRVLTKLIDCQTPRSGQHAWKCGHCGHISAGHNWCGDRHCLNCYTGHRMDWLDQMKASTLPCVYLHIVLTLPHELNDLVAANRRALYNLLFSCGTQTLLRQMRELFSVIPSITAALHTWGQVLLEHYHIHSVMSCGGLSLDGTRWMDVDPHDPRLSREALAPRYRELFLRELKKRYGKGKLALPPGMGAIQNHSDFEAWLAPIGAKDWMVNVQPPPPDCQGPATAIGYLGRYVAGTCVGDTRILADDGTHVTLRVKNYRQGGIEETLNLPGVEFVRRFALHILPPRLRRIRHAGLLCQRRRAEYLALCRKLLKRRIDAASAGEASPAHDAQGADPWQAGEPRDPAEPEPPRRCPRCLGRQFIFIESYSPHEDYSRLRRDPGAPARTGQPCRKDIRAPLVPRGRSP
jgi:hypothetical protein